jgi:hypothetical protein
MLFAKFYKNMTETAQQTYKIFVQPYTQSPDKNFVENNRSQNLRFRQISNEFLMRFVYLTAWIWRSCSCSLIELNKAIIGLVFFCCFKSLIESVAIWLSVVVWFISLCFRLFALFQKQKHEFANKITCKIYYNVLPCHYFMFYCSIALIKRDIFVWAKCNVSKIMVNVFYYKGALA